MDLKKIFKDIFKDTFKDIKISDYLWMTFGVALFAFAWEAFMIPNNFSSGGLTGLCTVLQYATGGAIKVSASYAVINVVLITLSIFIFGSKFGIKTIFCIAVSTFFFWLFPQWDIVKSLPGHFMYIPETLLIPVIAGLLEGTGLAIVFIKGGSTGGSDIIFLSANKYLPISPGKAAMVLDTIIIMTILLLPGRVFADLIYGLLMMIASCLTIDFWVLGRQSTAKVLIFSERYAEIADYVVKVMDRGVTAIKTIGWYTKQEHQLLLLLVRRSELSEVTEKVKEIDPNAFMSVSPTSSVFGEGFDSVKPSIKLKKHKKA